MKASMWWSERGAVAEGIAANREQVRDDEDDRRPDDRGTVADIPSPRGQREAAEEQLLGHGRHDRAGEEVEDEAGGRARRWQGARRDGACELRGDERDNGCHQDHRSGVDGAGEQPANRGGPIADEAHVRPAQRLRADNHHPDGREEEVHPGRPRGP